MTDIVDTRIHGICKSLQGLHKGCDEHNDVEQFKRLLDHIIVKITDYGLGGGYEFEEADQ